MSTAIKSDWRAMDTAPKNATEVRVLLPNNDVVEVAHWASDLSGEEQPPFRGWFKPIHDDDYRLLGYVEIATPVGWMPCIESKLDIANLDHAKALEWACSFRDEPQTWLAKGCTGPANNPARLAFAALSDPAAAAELIRQLIKRAGVSLNSWDPSEDYIELFTLSDGAVEVLHEDPDGLRKTWTVNSTKCITSLLVLAPDAGPGPVLEALRGER